MVGPALYSVRTQRVGRPQRVRGDVRRGGSENGRQAGGVRACRRRCVCGARERKRKNEEWQEVCRQEAEVGNGTTRPREPSAA